MKHQTLLLACAVCFIAAPARSQIMEGSTPEYSGPTARFDRDLDRYRQQDDALRSSRQRLEAVQRDRRNDLAVDRKNQIRILQTQNEMRRQREIHQRANEQYILKTNE